MANKLDHRRDTAQQCITFTDGKDLFNMMILKGNVNDYIECSAKNEQDEEWSQKLLKAFLKISRK
jgi:hypothetical protein